MQRVILSNAGKQLFMKGTFAEVSNKLPFVCCWDNSEAVLNCHFLWSAIIGFYLYYFQTIDNCFINGLFFVANAKNFFACK